MNSSDSEDSELEAEIAALQSIRNEENAGSEDNDDNQGGNNVTNKLHYNKASLEQKIKDIGHLDFVESLEVSEIFTGQVSFCSCNRVRQQFILYQSTY